MGKACSKLSACDGIPLIPPPMGPALARSKVIGGIPDELQDKLREDEDAMWENIRFATSDFELCRPGLGTPAPSLIAGLGTGRPIRLSPSEFEWEYRPGAVLEGSGWEQLQLDVSVGSCVPVTFSILLPPTLLSSARRSNQNLKKLTGRWKRRKEYRIM